jgi:ABC-type dipeptide/oligopeptide/nickel transport system permease component
VARRLITRFALLVVTSLGVAAVVFLVEFVLPGDPARMLVPRSASPQALELVRARLHLNDPLLLQFGHYFADLFRGNLGTSYVQREPVLSLIVAHLGATALLAAAGVVVEIAVGVPLGIYASLTARGRRIVTGVNMMLLSLPTFVLGLLLLLLFGFRLHVAPVTGGAGASQLILPALTLGLVGAPYYAQVASEEMTQALASSYARTAVAKGLPNRRIVVRHALRNTTPPLVTMLGLDLGIFLSGVVVVETVFGWPGIGLLAEESVQNLDRPVVLGIALLAALAVGVFNFIADVLVMYLDPRTRLGIA